MTEAPKEIWAETLNDWVGPGGYWDTSPNADSDPPDVKYIHEDESKAREEAAYKRGLEECLEIAAEWEEYTVREDFAPEAQYFVGRVYRAIRAKIDNA